MLSLDWEKNTTGETPKYRTELSLPIIPEDEAVVPSDPDFWERYNIIEIPFKNL